MKPLAPAQKLKLGGAVVVTLAALWFMKGLLPVFFPTLFIPSEQPAAGPPPPPAPEVVPAPPEGGEDGPDAISMRKLDELAPELTKEKVAADPIAALRRLSHIVIDYRRTEGEGAGRRDPAGLPQGGRRRRQGGPGGHRPEQRGHPDREVTLGNARGGSPREREAHCCAGSSAHCARRLTSRSWSESAILWR